jgi:hypothetical protein
MKSLRAFLKQRAWAVGLPALAALGAHCATPSPPERTLEGLAEMLGRSAGGVVAPKDIAWEPSPGFLSETFLGRRVMFLAAPAHGKPRDLYRARVRVTLEGQPISVRQLRNVTGTPLGDDMALEVREHTGVFATVAFGRIQGISVLELDGIRGDDRPLGVFDSLLLAITSFQQSGSLAGIGRTDVVLDLPAREARLTLELPHLAIDLGEKGRELVFDVRERTLRGAEGAQAYAARAVPLIHPPKPLILWGVDTVREEIGQAPIAWLENKVFGARDVVKRTTYSIFSSAKESALKEQRGKPVAAAVLDASKLEDEAGSWPPPSIPSIWEELKPGEGEWTPIEIPFLKPLAPAGKSAQKAPPYFFRAVIRPDPKRPYSEVVLVAMDKRQLELGMQAGFEDPKPLTGPAGDGRLPRDPEVLDRIVATFNGAFKTTHGKYGMMVDRRVLIPPVPTAATVMVTEDGETGLGSWPQTEEIPDEIVSFRQNLDPLIEDGVTNPTGRYIWGWQLSGTSVLTQRSALCVTPAGHLYYAFAYEIDGPTLGNALRQAGCSYAIHLDMNPGHCGFVFTDVVDAKRKEFNLKKLDPAMTHANDRFVRWSAKDFFYVMVRDPVPRDPSGVRWSADPGAQPPPAFMAGIFTGKLSIGSGLDVELTSFEKGRVDWRVRAGSKEPSVIGAPPKKLELSGDDVHRVLAAVGVGHATEATRQGLAFDGAESLPMRSGLATVVLGHGTPPLILPAGTAPKLQPDQEAVQLPLLAEDGQVLPSAREPGPMRLRAGMCVTAGGRVIVARTRHDSSDPVALALLRIGCKRVVELDRGSHHPAFVHRAGAATPPMRSYETSVLYAIGRPMLPHAFRWKAKGSSPSTKPSGFDFQVTKKTASNP